MDHAEKRSRDSLAGEHGKPATRPRPRTRQMQHAAELLPEPPRDAQGPSDPPSARRLSKASGPPAPGLTTTRTPRAHNASEPPTPAHPSTPSGPAPAHELRNPRTPPENSLHDHGKGHKTYDARHQRHSRSARQTTPHSHARRAQQPPSSASAHAGSGRPAHPRDARAQHPRAHRRGAQPKHRRSTRPAPTSKPRTTKTTPKDADRTTPTTISAPRRSALLSLSA